MPIPRNKVALNVAISLETRKILAKMAIDLETTMAELVEEMITIRYKANQDQQNGTI